jgi:hypothetical protein
VPQAHDASGEQASIIGAVHHSKLADGGSMAAGLHTAVRRYRLSAIFTLEPMFIRFMQPYYFSKEELQCASLLLSLPQLPLL